MQLLCWQASCQASFTLIQRLGQIVVPTFKGGQKDADSGAPVTAPPTARVTPLLGTWF
jgi:hypothetical protein